MKIFIAFGVCIILFTVAGDRGLPAVFKAQREAAELRAEIRRLRADNAGLRTRIASLRGDPGTIERIARETLGLARADELIVLASARPSADR
jgi:cell division protein FtsB